MAMALANELASFNIVVEKWDSSKIGGKRGGSKGKQEGAEGYTTARAGTSNTRAATQAALLQTLTTALALQVDGGGQGRQALEDVRS
jgi:hypothetical protein